MARPLDSVDLTSATSRTSQSARAGLTFPVGRVHRYLRKRVRLRVSAHAAVAMAGAMEYVVAELLELSGDGAKDAHSARIRPREVMLALESDSELYLVTRDVTVSRGGRPPYIEQVLIPAMRPFVL